MIYDRKYMTINILLCETQMRKEDKMQFNLVSLNFQGPLVNPGNSK